MTLKDLLAEKKKKSNVSEFLNFLFDQKLQPEFRSFSNLVVHPDLIEDIVELYQIEKDQLYFVLYYMSEEVMVFKINQSSNEVEKIFLLNKEKFKSLMSYFSTLLNFDKVKIYDRNSRIE